MTIRTVNFGPLLIWVPLGLLGLVMGLFVIWLIVGLLGVGIASATRSRRREGEL